MKNFWKDITLVVATLGVALGVGASSANAADWGPYQVEDRRSGYTYRTDEIRAMQVDTFQNPGMLWVEEGADLWTTVDGKAGKSCSTCHGDAAASMKGVGARYPVMDEGMGKLKNVEQQINICREKNMEAAPYKWESKEMLSMASFVNHQSLGMPIDVKVDGAASPFFEKGKAFYYERRGQLDMGCNQCHDDNAGNMIRADTLSQGQGNGFPTYRLKWQKAGSLHRRFRGCNKQVRSTPFGYGSDEYVNLELYVKYRGRGLPVETPAVRN